MVEPGGGVCGALVRGVDLSRPLGDALVADIRAAWLTHLVLAFPDQNLSDDDLERFSRGAGIDLPLRALVYEDGGGVTLAFPDIDAVAARHAISADLPVLAKMKELLAAVASEATGG